MTPRISIRSVAETLFFDRVKGSVRQRLELKAENGEKAPAKAVVVVRCAGEHAESSLVLEPGTGLYRCYAPVRWPRGAAEAAIELRYRGAAVARTAARIGTHRPWTIYLLSDLCADDTWAYEDLARHDDDDYRTTLAELDAGPASSYNFPTAYQLERYFARAAPRGIARLRRALAKGRFTVSPTPNQLLCGAFSLGAYPLLLEPYRRFAAPLAGERNGGSICAYHMEATTWSNGFANLCAAAGFSVFAKSLLRYQAPWLDALRSIPRLTRLEVAPGRFMYLLLRCEDYAEGMPLLEGLDRAVRYVHEEVIPAHERLGERYPASSIPLVGMYGDLAPASPSKAAAKSAVIARYNAQGWEYPRIVDSSWGTYGKMLLAEVGAPAKPTRRGLTTVRGDAGSSWEAWMLAAQAEAARMRRLERDVLSLRSLAALTTRLPRLIRVPLERAIAELVQLGDHAWNGSSDGSRALNLAVRRRRLEAAEKAVREVRRRLAPTGTRIAVVNTLAWERPCTVAIPESLVATAAVLLDPATGERFELERRGAASVATVPRVAGFGCRLLEVRGESDRAPAAREPHPPVPGWPGPEAVVVKLWLDGGEAKARGSWDGSAGHWRAGPFRVTASIGGERNGRRELTVEVQGTPPKRAYELRFVLSMPWKRCVWRAESGGGFVTPGATDSGGDSLLGVVGSILACGEGLSARARDGSACVDFAFGESGLCGLGGRSTARAAGTYGESVTLPGGLLPVTGRVDTAGSLEWYLLATAQNHREAFVDQGGARRWCYRCTIRRRRGGFDDAALYRFAAAPYAPAEITEPRLLARGFPSLKICGPGSLLALGLARRGRDVEVDLYNTSAKRVAARIEGALAEGAEIRSADMLGRAIGRAGEAITVGGKSYAKAVLTRPASGSPSSRPSAIRTRP